MTVTEFLAWDAGDLSGVPYQLIDGEPVAMAPGSETHAALQGEIGALLSSGNGAYAAGSFTQAGSTLANQVARWTGSKWLALGSGIAGSSSVAPRVHALAMISGKLYAAGLFASAGGTPASNIAMWDGSGWQALGGGLNGEVYALTVIGGDLYVGGSFTTADGISARGLAEYVPPSSGNPGGWKEVGGNPGIHGLRRNCRADAGSRRRQPPRMLANLTLRV